MKKHKKGICSNGFINHTGNQWYCGDGNDYNDATHFIDDVGGIVGIENTEHGRGYWGDDHTWHPL